MSERQYHEPFAFYDTGAPEGSSGYPTILMIHGLVWHSAVFQKVMSIAYSQNCRIVAINRRDYPGSKPHTDNELSLLLGSGEAGLTGFRQFMRDRGQEILEFVRWFIHEHDIPKKSHSSDRDDEHFGGLSILSWSAAINYNFAILANLSLFPKSLTEELEGYIRHFICYDTPYGNMGFGPPPGRASMMLDESMTLEERRAFFPVWVSGYYNHGPALSSSTSNIPEPSQIECRKYLNDPSPTAIRMGPEVVASLTDESVLDSGKSEFLLWRGLEFGFYSLQRREAIMKTEAGNFAIWPEVGIRILWCSRTFSDVPVGMWCLREELKEAEKDGRIGRKAKFSAIQGANHFAHWDEPERMLKAILGCIQE